MEKIKILIADDDDRHRAMLCAMLADWGYATLEATDGEQAVAMAARADLTLLDVRMPKKDGLTALREIKAATPETPVVIMTAFSEIPAAVEAIRKGAYDYLTKPLDFAKLEVTLRNAATQLDLERQNADLNASLAEKHNGLLGHSAPMLAIESLINTVAPTEATVLITGESGTGKELAAKAIHAASGRANGPFMAINCAALTESLLESELFGHEKGAFTGAIKKHEGIFARAAGGSIFLDEIGEMPLAMQVKLLRVLQEKEVLSVGGTKPRPVDCRVMAATNRDLAAEVAAGRFREDLYYRLNVVSIHMPPLRDRGDDIALLAQNFARRFSLVNRKNLRGIDAAAMARLLAYSWPGNVRELENVMERAVILMPGEYIGLHELPERFLADAGPAAGEAESGKSPTKLDMELSVGEGDPTLDEVERLVILRALKRFGNNKTEAARSLGITRKTLHAKLNRYKEEEK